ncbi:MAG: DUF1896 domain-containing protein [Prevotella sp.]|jgi:hypothetical protein|nr:DUF1896 domain-containing protein [Prevotella sp.]
MKYNSNSEPMEMSYFRLNLLSYLRDAHPDKANDFSFIAGRVFCFQRNICLSVTGISQSPSTFLEQAVDFIPAYVSFVAIYFVHELFSS